MSADDLIFGAYWGPRREAIDSCVDRTLRFFEAITRTEPTLRTWYEKARKASLARARPVDVLDDVVLRDLLVRGRNRRDTDKTVIEQLGYRVSLWNGDFDDGALVSVACGGWSEELQGLYNLATVQPPRRAEHLEDAQQASELLLGLSTPWDPDFARCGLRTVMYELDPPAARQAEVGWLTFLKAGRRVPSDVSAARVEALPTGTLIVATERARDCDVSRLVKLRDELDACGALDSV